MKLYHGTDDQGAEGIDRDGFARSLVRDSEGRSWFADSLGGMSTAGTTATWIVEVELPDEVAAEYRYRFSDSTPYLGNYLIPFHVVNGYRPFTFRRADSHEHSTPDGVEAPWQQSE